MRSDDELLKLSESFREKYIQFKENPPSSLYHYTDIRGVTGILSASKCWATSFKHMNDSTEFKIGIELASKLIREKAEDLQSKNYKKQAEEFCRFVENEKHNPKFRPYLLCLSELGDDLSQWRGYGDFGRGVSIDFNATTFCSLHDLPATNWFLTRVEYDLSQQESILRNAIDDWYSMLGECIKHTGGQLSPGLKSQLNFDIFEVIFFQSLRLKHHAFRAEKELRFVILAKPDNKEIKIRPGRFGPTDYIEVKFALKDVKSITLGPCCPVPDSSILQASLDSIFLQSGVSAPAILKSEIPFV